jgi:predicted RNA-binding Zn-ribbon protein involved in translation (DUF1610 family)
MVDHQEIEGAFYCIDCGHTKIPRCYIDRPSDLPDYNPVPKGGYSKDIRDDLPF